MKKSSKKFFSILLVCSVLVTTVLFACFNTEVSAIASTPWLHVEGIDIKDPRGNKVVLRGVSLPDLATNNYRKESGKSFLQLIDMLTNRANRWYSTLIRLPVYPIWGKGYNANPKKYYNNYIKPAVDKCVEKRIYCIIDWHYIDDPTNLDLETRAFWTDIAPKFKDSPNVIFEVFNENSTEMTWASWKNIVQPWVDLIRSYAPNNLILVGAPHYDQHLYDAPDNPVKGDNIVYVAHVYPGLAKSYWDSWIFNVANQIPIIITEWGFRKGATYPNSGTITNFGIPLKDKIEQYNLSWTSWVADYSWEPEMFDSNWDLLIGENYMGGFVKDYLYEKRRQRSGEPPLSKSSVDSSSVFWPRCLRPKFS